MDLLGVTYHKPGISYANKDFISIISYVSLSYQTSISSRILTLDTTIHVVIAQIAV